VAFAGFKFGLIIFARPIRVSHGLAMEVSNWQCPNAA
jgi:hypothetical protein